MNDATPNQSPTAYVGGRPRREQSGPHLTRPDLAGLGTQIQEARIEELPNLIGNLEALKAVAWSRITTANARAGAAAHADENLSVAEAARRLGISRHYLYRHAHRFPFTVKIGRRVLFSTRGLEVWLQRRQGR